MVKRGPKPASQRIAPKRPSRTTNKKSEPLTEVPQPPGYLGDVAKAYWREMAPRLVAVNLLTGLHLNTFAVLCEQYQEYRAYADYLAEDPMRCLFTTDNGYQQETPQVRMRNNALNNLNKLWAKFGLTPHGLSTMRKHGGVTAKLNPVQELARRKYPSKD